MELSKKQKKQLRRLWEKSYNMEYSRLLSTLHKRFHDWESGTISESDLGNLIHEFHNKDSRELYQFYNCCNDDSVKVLRGIKEGFISIEDIDESCCDHIRFLYDNIFRDK